MLPLCGAPDQDVDFPVRVPGVAAIEAVGLLAASEVASQPALLPESRDCTRISCATLPLTPR
jgi:hypothetical protein